MAKKQIRTEDVVERIRKEILKGKFAPGNRIPTCREWQKITGASHLTVFAALQTLTKEKLLVPRGRSGTFVADSAPHFNEYAVVWSGNPREKWSYLYKAIKKVVQTLKHCRGDYRIQEYGQPGQMNMTEYERLFDDVRQRKIAGVMMMPTSFDFSDSPLETKGGIPTIALLSGQARAVVRVDFGSFYLEGIKALKEKGAQKIAFLCPGEAPLGAVIEEVKSALRSNGMTCYDNLIQGISTASPEWVHQVLSLMMSGPVSNRPDSLLVVDDNLVPMVTDWLADRIFGHMKVAALANAPALPMARVPVSYIGFDATEIIARCIENLKKQKEGKHPSSVMLKARAFNEAGGVTKG